MTCYNIYVNKGDDHNINRYNGNEVKMRFQEFKQAVNNEFVRCAKYEPNVKISVEDCAEISEYFTNLIWDFMAMQKNTVSYPEYLGATIYEAAENCETLDCEVYFDIGLKKAFVLEWWYENEIEYVFDIKEY